MKTPHLDLAIETCEKLGIEEERLAEFKAIKKQLENNPIVSTPDNPVWVVDEYGNKLILFADLGLNVIDYRFLTVNKEYVTEFLSGKPFDYDFVKNLSPYTEKVSIEVTKDEKVMEIKCFLKEIIFDFSNG